MSVLSSRFECGNAGDDTLVAENVVGGPMSGKDVRMYLDRQTLEHLLSVATQSLVGRVQLNGVGLKVRAYRGGDGHVYEAWSLVSAPPIPERSSVLEGLTGKKNG